MSKAAAPAKGAKDNTAKKAKEETKEILLEADLDEYIAKLKEKEQEHIEGRDAIAKTVEKKQGELNFLKSLTPDDVIYFEGKKKVYAARVIWVSHFDFSEHGEKESCALC